MSPHEPGVELIITLLKDANVLGDAPIKHALYHVRPEMDIFGIDDTYVTVCNCRRWEPLRMAGGEPAKPEDGMRNVRMCRHRFQLVRNVLDVYFGRCVCGTLHWAYITRPVSTQEAKAEQERRAWEREQWEKDRAIADAIRLLARTVKG